MGKFYVNVLLVLVLDVVVREDCISFVFKSAYFGYKIRTKCVSHNCRLFHGKLAYIIKRIKVYMNNLYQQDSHDLHLITRTDCQIHAQLTKHGIV